MPKSRNDPHKRKCAQALNHLAGAVLDLNDVYEVFNAQTEMLRTLPDEAKQPNHSETLKRYEDMTNDLKTAMMGTMVIRESIVRLIGVAWDLDEDTIKVYLG